MAQRIEITNPVAHAGVAALVNQPGYYYLYALYADYPINNAWLRRRETAAVLGERLRVIQPLLAALEPYRKSAALRLFTERAGSGRFPPERVSEAWRQLRALLEYAGPPAGWPEAPPPAPPYREALPAGLRRRPGRAAARPIPARGLEAEREPSPRRRRPHLPKSPVDYTQDV